MLRNQNDDKLLYLTPEVIKQIKLHALAGIDEFIIENTTQRSEIPQDFYMYHAQITIDGIRFTGNYLGRAKWLINIML